jgi:hypothetical protein
VLTKTVLYATAGGDVKLVEVPFEWQHGEPLPLDALEQRFPTAIEALHALSARGRAQQRVHVPQPERKPKENAATPPAEQSPAAPTPP